MKKFLIIHISSYRNNYFISIVDAFGKVLVVKNAGELGFKNIKKRSLEALQALINAILKVLLTLRVPNLFLNFEGLNVTLLKEFYKYFLYSIKHKDFRIIGYKLINKIPHNGCRAKKN